MRDCIDLSVQKDILKMNVHKKLVSVHLQISLLYIYFFFSFMFGGLDFFFFLKPQAECGCTLSFLSQLSDASPFRL